MQESRDFATTTVSDGITAAITAVAIQKNPSKQSIFRVPLGNASYEFRFDIVERTGLVRPKIRRFNRGCERGR